METFKGLASSLSSSVSSTVFSTVSSLKEALPGNNVTKHYEVQEHVASAGPHLLWRVYRGVKRSTRESASVFVLEKKQLEQQYESRREREQVLEIFKSAIAKLTRLRHPQVLIVQHGLEESRDCLAFATEPVFCSLANLLGRTHNGPASSKTLSSHKLFDVEIKYGLQQLCEGLTFLHESVKMIHGNLCPESIVVNEKGAWRIFGFDFSLNNISTPNNDPTWSFPEYLKQCAMPDLDFLAPEYALREQCTVSTDMFSLGMIAFAVYNSKPLFTNNDNWATFKNNVKDLKSLRESNLHLIPSELREYLRLLLSPTPDLRPTASQLAKISFFEDDVGVKTLNNLDSQFQFDNLQKSQFYKSLPAVLNKLPHRVALHRVVPCLAKEYVNANMVPFVLPTVLQIAQEATKEEFENHIWQELKQVMRIQEPIQILLIFMQRMELLLSKAPASDVKTDVLPMLYRALESDASQIQELCLSIMPGFAASLDYQATKNSVLPRLRKLCISTTLLSVRVNCLICLGKLLPHLDRWLVIDEVLPIMQQIPSREPAVIMGMIGIYRMAVDDEKLGLTKELLATKVLPFLLPLSIENGLTVNQFNIIMTLIRRLLDKVESEHQQKLQQLNSIREEQKSALDVGLNTAHLKSNELISERGLIEDSTGAMFKQMGLNGFVSKEPSSLTSSLMEEQSKRDNVVDVIGNKASGGGTLSLEEKRRLAQNSEKQRSMQQQSTVMTPQSSTVPSAMTNKTNPGRDLTSTLMSQNLSQMSNKIPKDNSNEWGGFAVGKTMGNMGNNLSHTMGSISNVGNMSTDLSAFDSLAPLPTRQPMTLNAMMTTTKPPINSSSVMQASPVTQSTNKNASQLSTKDIDDLLS